MKYDNLIKALDDDELYTPGVIANFARSSGYVDSEDPEVLRLEVLRIRVAMGRFSNNHAFPDQGDGMIVLRGQAPTPGWFGWRWKAARRKAKQWNGI